MLNDFLVYIILVLIILLLVMVAAKLKVAYPIVLVVGGLLLSLFSGIPDIHINPEYIFIIFLPPLLYEAAWNTSWKELWRWRRVISSFAFLIVIVTSLVVALIATTILPGFTLALGFLLGGIVSPPDAVSATSVLKYVKAPRSTKSIIEGESLLNDASSLIVFRFALIAVDTGHFLLHQAALSFLLVIAMGILIGVLVALVYYAIHRWLPTTANIDIVLTLTAPYVMYIAAESFHFSGVLAVVSGGLFLSARRHRILSHRSRLRGANVWSTLGFVLNGLVFMLIGLTLPVIVKQLGNVSLGAAIGYGLMITGVLIVTRLLSTLGASAFTVFISRFITTANSRPGWRGPIVFGWAGMRGVVSLAAALSIPVKLPNGLPFPERSLIIFITFIVILFTLLIQGLTLPWVVKKMALTDNDNLGDPLDQEKALRKKLAIHSVHLLEEKSKMMQDSNPALRQLTERYRNEEDHDGIEREMKDYRKVYLEVIAAQRTLLHEINKKASVDEDVIRKQEGLLDLEEEKLRIRFEPDSD